MPRPGDIPFIGPLLSLYLKGRAAVGVWKKLGGKLPKSARTEVAARAAETRNRIRQSVISMTEAGADTAATARKAAPSVAAILGRRIFHDEEAPPPAPPKSKRPTMTAPTVAVWRARALEIQLAEQPGAIERVMRRRLLLDDPYLSAEIVSTFRRKVAYLSKEMPRAPAGVGTKADPWQPPPAEAARFARILDAVDNPAGVFERAARGGDVDLESMDAVKAVYPALYAEAGLHVLQQVADNDEIPHHRLQQLGLLFDLPLDASQDPIFAAAMQAGYDLPEPLPAPSPQPPPPAPSIAGPVNLAKSYELSENRQ